MSKHQMAKTRNSDEYANQSVLKPSVRAYLVALGRLGGQRKSDAKAKAARQNGKQHKVHAHYKVTI